MSRYPKPSMPKPTARTLKIAKALNGDVRGYNWIEAPAPGADRSDRSLQVAISHSAPDGFCIISRSISRIEARAHVLAAIQRAETGNVDGADLFGGLDA